MKVVGAFLASLASSAFWAFVLQVNWGWFAVPFGAPALSFGQAWGLMILSTSFTGTLGVLIIMNDQARPLDFMIKNVIGVTIMALTSLAMGAAINFLFL